jgi:hypothetical protein
MALTGRIPFEINNVESIGVTNVDVSEDTPTNQKNFMNGDTDLVSGTPRFSATVTCSTFSDKQVILDQIEAAVAADPDAYFSASYKLGSRYYTLTKCRVNNTKASASVDDASLTVSIMAGGRIRNQ